MFQNEKCHLLIEHETHKLKELDEENAVELKEWRDKLRPRKKVIDSSVGLPCCSIMGCPVYECSGISAVHFHMCKGAESHRH